MFFCRIPLTFPVFRKVYARIYRKAVECPPLFQGAERQMASVRLPFLWGGRRDAEEEEEEEGVASIETAHEGSVGRGRKDLFFHHKIKACALNGKWADFAVCNPHVQRMLSVRCQSLSIVECAVEHNVAV